MSGVRRAQPLHARTWCQPYAVVVQTPGPTRVSSDNPTTDLRRHPLGFAPTPDHREPLLWEGDQA